MADSVTHDASHGAGKRRRPVWPWIALGVVLVLLVVAFFIVDNFARAAASTEIEKRLTSALALPAGTPVDVTVGGGPVLFQLAGGALDSVDVSIDDAVFGELIGDLEVHAEGIPLDPAKPTTLVEARYAMPESSMESFKGALAGIKLDSVGLDDPEIVATASFSLFGFSLDIGMGLEPSAQDGQLTFEPTSIRVGDTKYTADQLKSAPGLGLLAPLLLQQQAVCVAKDLPAPLVLTNVSVEGDELVALLEAHDVPLTDFSTKGSCA